LNRAKELFDLSSKVALITGAAGTLGAKFAETLASEGAKVFIADRKGEELSKVAAELQTKGFECEWIKADLTQEEDIDRAFSRCEESLGHIDILVNSVGDSVYKPTLELSLAELINLTKALAVEWARFGINVNAIAPSFVFSRLTRVILEDPQGRKHVLDRTPLRRLAQPEDLLGALIFLASSASDYVTGQVIVVDGGWCAW